MFSSPTSTVGRIYRDEDTGTLAVKFDQARPAFFE